MTLYGLGLAWLARLFVAKLAERHPHAEAGVAV